MKYYPLKYLFPLSIILLITILFINSTQFKKISISRELSKSSKPKKVSSTKSSKPKKVSKTSSAKTDFSFSNIDGQTGMNSNTGEFGISECYKVLKSTTGDFTESSNLANINKITDVIVQSKINGKGEFDFASTYKLINYFTSPENTITFFYFKKISRVRTFSYDTELDKLLTPGANTLLKNTITKKDQIYIHNCGDSVIDNVVEGGIIIVEVLINFLKPKISESFMSKFGKNFVDLNKLHSKILETFKNLRSTGNISIIAKQIGGNLKKFMELFPRTKNYCSGNTNDPEITEEGNDKTCGTFISNIDSYLKKDFKLLFTNNSIDSTILEINKNILKDLKIPPVENGSLEIKSLKKKIIDFTNQNDYYLEKIKSFNENYPSINIIESVFDDASDDFVRKLKHNDFLLKENADGVFRFNDCFSNLQSCTKVNFDKSYANLFKDFAGIDKLYSEMKYLYNYDLKIKDCGLSLGIGNIAEVSVRIYPLGNNKYGVTYLKSKFDLYSMKDWHWIGGEAKSFNEFEFLMNPVALDLKVINTPKSGLKVNTHCSTMDVENIGYKVANPNYFLPYVLEK